MMENSLKEVKDSLLRGDKLIIDTNGINTELTVICTEKQDGKLSIRSVDGKQYDKIPDNVVGLIRHTGN